jgi:hypothetical protein
LAVGRALVSRVANSSLSRRRSRFIDGLWTSEPVMPDAPALRRARDTRNPTLARPVYRVSVAGLF